MLILLDRDGVLNKVRYESYVTTWSEFHWMPGAKQGLAVLASRGHRVAVVTNQAAIGKGIVTKSEVDLIHRRMCEEAEEVGGRIDAIYVCPHTIEDNCGCRKPVPGMLLRALADFHVDADEAIMIGDATSDRLAATRAGVRFMKLDSAIKEKYSVTPEPPLRGEQTVSSLLEAAGVIDGWERST